MLTRLVKMRDGVRLATDVHLPPNARDGDRFPVIVERTPYGRADVSGSEVSLTRDEPLKRDALAEIMADRGYVVVMQDVRGRGDSEGIFAKYINEAEDGVDCYQWILEQPWCDGRICTMGLSYGGHTQLAAAVAGAPGIAAMSIDTGGLMDLWRHSLRLGGGFELKQVTWAFRHAAKSLRAKGQHLEADKLETADIRAAIQFGDWRTGYSPLAAAPEYEATVLHMWTLGESDEEICGPATRAAAHFDRFPDVPVMLLGSWFDPYASNMIELASAIRAQNSAPLRRIMGPWLHGKRSTGRVGDADFGDAATLDSITGRDWITLRLDWFDFALGRGPMPLDHDLFFEMTAAAPANWPKMSGHWHADLQNTTNTLPIPHPKEPIELAFNVSNPFPTLGGGVTSGGALMAGGMYDHRAKAATLLENCVCLSSGPLSAPFALAGCLTLELDVINIEPAGPFDISAVLMMRTEDGAFLNITDGFLRLQSDAQRGTLKMLDTFVSVPKGAELCILLSTANFPRIDTARKENYRATVSLRNTRIG